MKLQRAWSPNWIAQHCRSVSRENGDSASASISRRDFESQNRISGVVRRVLNVKPSNSAVMFVTSPENWGCWEKSWHPQQLVSGRDVPPAFAKFPNTLSDFRIWWDNIAATHTFVIPESIAIQGYLFRAGIIEGGADLTGAHTKDSLEEVELSINYEFLQDPPRGPGPLVSKDAFPFALQGDLSSSQEEALFGLGESVSFPVATYREVQVDQGELVKSFTNWHVGTFEKSFGDLAHAAHDLEDLDMEDVRKTISEEATKGDETLEAFGMKFQAGQISLWGTSTLLSVQLYLLLLLYVKQLSGRLRVDDPGWDTRGSVWTTSSSGRDSFSL